MNNEQFRRLLAQNGNSSSSAAATAKENASTPSTLGSRMRSSIPMTPRNVAGSSSSLDFARQLREANAPPKKKFKSTAAPKGTKLATGYVDRARLREDTNEDDAAKRIKALEEMVKLGQMEPEAFERVRDEIIGGDITQVHLVKGLDRRLLERTRRGEDVFSTPQKEPEPEPEPEPEEPKEDVDLDEAFDEIEAKEVVPTLRTKQIEDLEESTARRKRTRNDILRELKEARQKATQPTIPQQPALGSKFRRVAEQLQPGTSRLEIDEKGREVLVLVDKNGNVKRKVKKSKPVKDVNLVTGAGDGITAPRKDVAPLGADVVIPDRPPPPTEEPENEDIFADAGTDYDPLAGLEESGSESGSESGEESNKQVVSKDMPPPPQPSKPRNYFNEKPSVQTEFVSNPAQDPEFLAAIRKTATVAERIDRFGSMEDDEETLRKLARRKEMLQAHDRDADDLDLGFGSSRFDDQDEGEDTHVKLSKWNGIGDDQKGQAGQSKRKRGGKNRKGDKNSAADVLAVLDRRAKG